MISFDFRNQWAEDIEDIFKNPIVNEFILKNKISIDRQKNIGKFFSDKLYDVFFKSYGKKWDSVAKQHEDNTLYERMANFASFSKNDLIVDIGCGSGNFLTELAKRGFRKLIGIDISPYALKTTFEKLKKIIPETECRPESVVSFDPSRGFFLKGLPIMDELDFSKPQIICDDMRTMDNLIRTLYMQGIKVDAATFMLHGGFNAEGLEFFRFLFPEHFKKENDPEFMLRKVESIMPKIIKKRGFFVYGLRGGIIEMNSKKVLPAEIGKIDRKDITKSLNKAYKKLYTNTLAPISWKIEPMVQEHDLVGLRMKDPAYMKETYHCLLAKIIIKESKEKK